MKGLDTNQAIYSTFLQKCTVNCVGKQYVMRRIIRKHFQIFTPVTLRQLIDGGTLIKFSSFFRAFSPRAYQKPPLINFQKNFVRENTFDAPSQVFAAQTKILKDVRNIFPFLVVTFLPISIHQVIQQTPARQTEQHVIQTELFVKLDNNLLFLAIGLFDNASTESIPLF